MAPESSRAGNPVKRSPFAADTGDPRLGSILSPPPNNSLRALSLQSGVGRCDLPLMPQHRAPPPLQPGSSAVARVGQNASANVLTTRRAQWPAQSRLVRLERRR